MEISEKLENYILHYMNVEKDDPYKGEYWELKDKIKQYTKELSLDDDLGTTSICWVATRLYFQNTNPVCKYAKKKNVKIIDEKVLTFLKEKYGKIQT